MNILLRKLQIPPDFEIVTLEVIPLDFLTNYLYNILYFHMFTGDHLPTPPPIPEAIQKLLAILYSNAAKQVKDKVQTF